MFNQTQYQAKLLPLVAFYLVMLSVIGLTGCSRSAADPAGVLTLSWEQIESQARGKSVNFFMWGGDPGVNRYIDAWVAPRLEEEYGIRLKRYPMNAAEFINKLLAEKQSRRPAGTMDILWINGENFKTARENDLLLGPIAGTLPNFREYVAADSPEVRYDFGYPTEGYEVPWGKVQFVLSYDAARVTEPPGSLAELVSWVEAHPGKFTYPAPPDFTGSAFIRHFLYAAAGGYEPFLQPFDPAAVSGYGEAVWGTLNAMEPHLWRQGKTYPQSLAQLEQLYKNGEVWFSMGYDEAHASALVVSGQFPPTTRTLVLEGGTLANTHFLAVPYNAPHPAAALVAINFLLSPDAQLKKMELTYWGENTSLDVNRLPGDYRRQIQALDRGPATLPEEVLAGHRLPEIGPEYVEWLERGWLEHVAR